MLEQDDIDLEYIREVKKGNKEAFDILVLRYQYKIFKIVAQHVYDHSEILDITQETFIKAYKALPTFREESSFYTWIYRIAINTAKNYMTSKGRKVSAIEFELSDIEPFLSKWQENEYSTPEHLLMCDEMEHILYLAIEELPKELRTSILLREIEGLTYDEISAVMDCPVGTVRSRIFRAREVIENRISPLFVDDNNT